MINIATSYEKVEYLLTLENQTISGSKIVCQKYENLLHQIRVQGTANIPGHMYVALKNPKINDEEYKYIILPMVRESDDEAVLELNSIITFYSGIWEMIILAVDSTIQLPVGRYNADLPNDQFLYVSKPWKRLVVQDNFLSDKAKSLTIGGLNRALEDYMKVRDTIDNEAIRATEDADRCEEHHLAVDAILAQCQEILARCEEIYNELKPNQ